VLRGKYRLDRVLGMGGMATVYAATHRNGNEFAVKVLHPDLSLRSELRTRFLREGHAASAVKHPGAVTDLDDDVAEDGSAFLVMELLRGESVEILGERRGNQLPLNLVVGIGIQLLDVLAAAHAHGVIHRDIKPANLFLTHHGQLKVLDFGIARLRDMAASQATQTGMMMGTPAFMAPEQAMAKTSEIDAQTDVWAAGASMFTLASGRLVHEAENAQQIMIRAATTPAPTLASVLPDAPPLLCEVIDRALAFEKTERWSGAAAMREALLSAARSVFGEAPTAQTLAELLEDLGEAATVVQASPLVHGARFPVSTPATEEATAPLARSPSQPQPAVATPFRGAPIAELATAQPVSADTLSKRAAITRARFPLAIVLGAGGLTLGSITVVLIVLFARTSGQTDAQPGATLSTSASATTASAPITTSAIVVSASPPAATDAPTVPAGSTQIVSVDQLPTVGAPSSLRPTPVSPATAAPKLPNCATPYTFDAQGNRKWKRECIR
jgi:serine/threonine-protein kinase